MVVARQILKRFGESQALADQTSDGVGHRAVEADALAMTPTT